MNTMNMPGFTADASLYKTSGHYQTSRNTINLPTRMVGAISTAMITEVIPVSSCRPGFLQLGEGESMVCVDPIDPFGTGGHGGGGGPFPGDGEPTGGGDGEHPPKHPPTPGHFCTFKDLFGDENPAMPESWKRQCKATLGNNAYLWCVPGKKLPIKCCAKKGGRTTCVGPDKLKQPPTASMQ